MNKSTVIYQKRIYDVIKHVNNHLDENISLEALAKVACFSPFHFHRIFVAMTGESLNFFTNRLRLEMSTKLLRFSKNSLSQVSMDCGYSSPSVFSRAFKKYFGVSPGHFRKHQTIENSKICKELFPINEYLVPMTEQELTKAFPVKIKEFPERKIGFIRVANSYQEGVVIKAFEQITAWAKKRGVYKHASLFGMSLDDPLVTPHELYRYEVCISLPDTFVHDAEKDPEIMTLPKSLYATVRAEGSFNFVATGINFLFNHWLINSAYEPAHLHGMEIFKDKDKSTDWSAFDLELCLPIKKIS